MNTQTGKLKTNAVINVEDLTLPQFTIKRTFKVKFHILQKDFWSRFECIIGREIQQNLGLDFINLEIQIQWSNILIPIVSKNHWKQKQKLFKASYEPQDDNQDNLLLESNYKAEDLSKITQ